MMKNPCPHCGIAERDQHTLGQAGICDGIRGGKISQAEGQARVKKIPFTTKNK